MVNFNWYADRKIGIVSPAKRYFLPKYFICLKIIYHSILIGYATMHFKAELHLLSLIRVNITAELICLEVNAVQHSSTCYQFKM